MLTYQNEKWAHPRLDHRDFRVFFESTRQAMFVEDRDGYVVSVNAAACKLWGASCAELTGKHAAAVLPPRLGTSGVGIIRRSSHTRPDGSTIAVEVLSTPLTLGDEEAFLTTVWELSGEAEGQLELALFVEPPAAKPCVDSQAAKMEALRRFAEKLSHDFNNILTSVVGFSSLMKSRKDLSDDNRRYLEQIQESAQRAEKLTGELLQFGRVAPRPAQSFDPVASITQASEQLRALLPDRITLTTICEDGSGPIAGEEETLIQILVQLATNTREAMDGAAEGELKIEVESGERRATVLRVSDNGPGMDELSAAAAFEPFFSTRSDHKMRGLGLARVYAKTQDLGGTVTLRSAHGKGTCFTFTFPPAAETTPVALPAPVEPERDCLPVAAVAVEAEAQAATPVAPPEHPAAAPAPAPAAAPAPEPAAKPAPGRSKLPGGPETILVVEDEPMVREIVVRSLTHLGYTVHKACDGQEGLELSRELADEVDLIFSDIVMPRLSGPEMVQRIREEQRRTPVLFTTGFTESRHLLENGGDLREGIDLLQKPYTPNILAERVREKLDSVHG